MGRFSRQAGTWTIRWNTQVMPNSWFRQSMSCLEESLGLSEISTWRAPPKICHMLFCSILAEGSWKFSQSLKVLMTKYAAHVHSYNMCCLIQWPIISVRVPRSPRQDRSKECGCMHVHVCLLCNLNERWVTENIFLTTFQTFAISAQFILALSNGGGELKWKYSFSLNSPLLNFDLQLMASSISRLPHQQSSCYQTVVQISRPVVRREISTFSASSSTEQQADTGSKEKQEEKELFYKPEDSMSSWKSCLTVTHTARLYLQEKQWGKHTESVMWSLAIKSCMYAELLVSKARVAHYEYVSMGCRQAPAFLSTFKGCWTQVCAIVYGLVFPAPYPGAVPANTIMFLH